MTGSTRVLSRRVFLRDLGHGAAGVAVFGIVGCSRGPTGSFDPLTYADNLDEIESFWCTEAMPRSDPALGPDRDQANPPRWARIGEANSSGYVLVRGSEATIVDTASWCVPEVIEGGLKAVGLDWSAVGSVIVTHKHPDHWIGLSTALEHAPDAAVFAGAADIPFIASPRSIVPVGAGDRVMDLAIIPTPGHTPGHIAVHDEAAGVLVVGDAIAGARKRLELLPTSEDLEQAQASVRVLAGLSFDTLLAGHGIPIVGGAWEELTDYLART